MMSSHKAYNSGKFHPKMLFEGELAGITPLFWIAYIFNSLAVNLFSNWTPLVFEAMGYKRELAISAASFNSFISMAAGLVLMRFIDNKGAIAIAVLPAIGIPLLLIAGFVDLPPYVFLGFATLISVSIGAGLYGLQSCAALFYPSAFRANGAGWASSVAKIGAIFGPQLPGILLTTTLPVRNIYAVAAVCPAVFLVCIFIVGRLHSRILAREKAGLAAGGVSAAE